MMAEEECFTLEDTGILFPVGNQGACQCCYAFVGTACVSSVFAREKNRMGQPLVRLSIQELVDCLHDAYPPRRFHKDQRDCYLNTNNNAFRYMMSHGVSLEEQYPYQERRGSPPNTQNNRKMRINGFYKVANLEWDEKDINSQIQYQPLAGVISIYPSFTKFQGEGIYMGPEGEEKSKGFHGLQVIGYGVENGIKYLKILNSWGKNWGSNGTAKVRRDLITRLSFPYGANLDGEADNPIPRQRASKLTSQKQHDSSSKMDKDKRGSTSKKNDPPSSSSIKQRGQSKTHKVGQKRSRSIDNEMEDLPSAVLHLI